ncbi:hypothetical protein B0T10DRAFT_472158 [Thelonectria olida]|uniref:Protein kinase domain-containing protein n=1 Tax=Thelonectria olida TaxID=1576542 RepID=A0A9P9ASG2_9HYPO|nr:hypothetical protein B0T10DRAFT_472158 [Thelonectria olida]
MQRHVSKGFNIANVLRRHYVFPSAGFAPFPNTKGYAQYDEIPKQPEFEPPKTPTWAIDYASFGTVYAAIPTSLESLPPSRIDVAIPDQMDWPASLWSTLDARDSVHLAGPRISSLGISSYLCEGLQHWADSLGNFADVYADLPFGSSLQLSNLTEDAKDLKFTIQPNKALEKPGVFLSSEDLCSLWGFGESEMPPTIPYTSLRRLNQVAGDVIIVSIAGHDGLATDGVESTMVFKSSTNKPSKIYHEIKMLLSVLPLKTVIGRPKYLVTIPDSQAVCGFLLTHYPGGDLSDILTERRLAGTLNMPQQLSWACALTSSLIHIKNSPMKFYSDLRMDQLVLSPNPDGSEVAILLDFEQSRNIYNWAPPEIYYLEWIAELGNESYARCAELYEDAKDKYGKILNRYLISRDHPLPLTAMPQCYDNPDIGWYWPWLTSSAAERESGMVYMLGKALWCIFEGTGDADIVLGRSSINDGQPRFPEFLRTPPAMQEVIKRCTAGAREWLDGPIKIYRREGKVFPLGKTGLRGEPEATFEETKEAVKLFWKEEMRKAEEFVEARMRYDRDNASDQDLELLHYLKRPTLDEVLMTLEQTDASLL